ncbi:MAG: GNAT family N-acetyltransferase [Anaerolineae bacterium]|nr:GNAT family N-acetyltransferase [Anaerolineae bacterium]
MTPTIRDFPDYFETERLLIRAPRPGDGKIINAGLRESIVELRPWMPWAKEIPPVEESEQFARRGAAGWLMQDDMPLLIFRRTDGVYLGGSGFHRIEWAIPSLEIGYWLRTSQTGNGYMTEAVIGMTKFAFEVMGVERIEIRCDSRNTRSAAIAQRAGYTREALFRHHLRAPDGSLRDTLVFARLAGD